MDVAQAFRLCKQLRSSPGNFFTASLGFPHSPAAKPQKRPISAPRPSLNLRTVARFMNNAGQGRFETCPYMARCAMRTWIAPKGRQITAHGVSRGNQGRQIRKPWKGERKGGVRRECTDLFRPLRAGRWAGNRDPWLTPWATIFRPLRGLQIRVQPGKNACPTLPRCV